LNYGLVGLCLMKKDSSSDAMNLGQIYIVRRNSEICFEGNIVALKAWLSAKRITGDDEIKRQGYEVLEGEQLWSLVSDRAELGFNPITERDKLGSMRSALTWLMSLAILSLIFAGYLFYINILIPAIEVDRIREKLNEENAERVRTFEQKTDAVLRAAEARVDRVSSELEKISSRLQKLSSDIDKSADISSKVDASAAIESMRADTKRVLDWYETRISSLEKSQQSTRVQAAPTDNPSKQERPATFDDVLSVRWVDAESPGFSHIIIQNKTSHDLTVKITRTYGANRLYYTVKVPAGRVYSSGERSAMTDSSGGIRAFTKGDMATISVRESLPFRSVADANVVVK
jgi:hypothetical protein